MRVVGLWRYPVKSMGGEAIDRAVVDGKIPGDREWGVFDTATGRLLSAKSVPALLAATARFDGEVTTIALPGGRSVVAGTADADGAIGDWLGRGVTLRRAHDRATIDVELDDGTGHGPHGSETFETPVGSLFDSRSTLHLISLATLTALDRDHWTSAGDARRYRPNIVIDGADAFAEDDWVGRDVRIGELTANVRKKTGRCVMISRAQPGVLADRALLRYLVEARQNMLGVYLDPRGAGPITVGSSVDSSTTAAAGAK
jgi:uncharacterized protein YcbX